VLIALAVGGGMRVPRAAAPARSADSFARIVDSPGARFSQARLARSGVTWIGGPTTAATGEVVTVYVSTSLGPQFGTPQTWADFFAGLVHGGELSSLTAYVATLAEVREICAGEHVLGCYGSSRLVTLGEVLSWAVPTEVATHEYGHHVATNRDNHPWLSVEWGTKRWASVANVCARAAAGAVFPGDEGDHYTLNPGEGFAEVYRATNESKKGALSFNWQVVDPSFYPSPAALKAAEQDVLQPWTAPTTKVVRAQFLPKGKRTWTLLVATPLDGELTVTLSFPKGRADRLTLLGPDGKTVLATGLWSATTVKAVSYAVCGQRSVIVNVSLVGSPGRFAVLVAKP